MTTGNIVFFSGAGLFVFAILLGIGFLIKKPKYEPEKTVYDGRGKRKKQSFRHAYQTERVTVQWEKPSLPSDRQETAALYGRAESAQGTEIITGNEYIEETEIIAAGAGNNGAERFAQEHTERSETELI